MSPRLFRLSQTARVALALLGLASVAAAGDSILLKPVFDGGDAYVEHEAEAKQKMTGPDGSPAEIDSRTLVGLLARLSGKGDGAELSVTLDRLAGSLSFTEAIKNTYDSDDPEAEDASPDYKAAYTPILNMPLKVLLDGQGVATGVEGGEAIRAKLVALGSQNFIATSLATEELSDSQIMATLGETALVLYPWREVKLGETWQKTQRSIYPQIGKVILTYECKLEKIEQADADEVAIVRFTGTLVKDPQEQPAEGKRLSKIDGRFSGVARFSKRSGRFVEIQRETHAQIEVPTWWNPDPAVPLMKIDGQFKNRYRIGLASERTQQKQEIARRVAETQAARAAEEAAALAAPVEPVTSANAAVAWLQWGGPNRDFSSESTGLANRWPKAGPPKLWERPLGDGFSAILCDGAALYTQYSVRDPQDAFKGDEVVVALNASSGKTLWEHKYAAPWPKDLQMEFGPGPHSTPIVVGERVFAVGATAQLVCLDKRDGKLIWSKDLHAEFKAALNMRGYGSSPLAHQGNILLPISSESGHGVIAFSQADGAVAWKGGDLEPGYASLLAIQSGGGEQIVAFTGKDVRGMEAGSGALRWSVAHPTQFGANISTPLWSAGDQTVFISSAYGMGSRCVKLDSSAGQTVARELWINNKLKIQHATAVRAGEWIFCSSGDFGPALLVAVNARTGEFGWRQRGFAKANVLYADGKLILLDEEGTLGLVKADGSQYRLLAKASDVCSKTAWTVPTLYGRTLYVRDRAKVLALDLGATSSP